MPLANSLQIKSRYNLFYCNGLIFSVEHIGVEPMTS